MDFSFTLRGKRGFVPGPEDLCEWKEKSVELSVPFLFGMLVFVVEGKYKLDITKVMTKKDYSSESLY